MKVLVATNARTSEKDLRMILEAEGHECLMVDRSDQTIDTIYHDTPEMVMLDEALARPSAIEILAKLKSAPSTWDKNSHDEEAVERYERQTIPATGQRCHGNLLANA